MTHRMAPMVGLMSGMFFLLNGQAAAQVVGGSGTPGTVPVWTGDGTMLTDSHIQDNGTTVNVALPLGVTGSGSGPAVFGSGGTGPGIGGSSSGDIGVVGSTSGTSGQAGVAGFGIQNGVMGFESATDVGWGVKGIATGGAVGVEGSSSAVSFNSIGVRGTSYNCDQSSCMPGIGAAGQFVVGPGGNILHGLVANFNGPGGWDEKFRVDSSGNLSIYGNAFKPGGGPWSTLSDRRLKQSIQPINEALNQLLQLHGVTYEYANPSAFHELPGMHIGMVAQDVEQVFPSWVDTGKDGYKRLTFRGFEAVTVEAVRELDAQVSANSKAAMSRIADLERQNAELRHAIEVLSETVKSLQQK